MNVYILYIQYNCRLYNISPQRSSCTKEFICLYRYELSQLLYIHAGLVSNKSESKSYSLCFILGPHPKSSERLRALCSRDLDVLELKLFLLFHVLMESLGDRSLESCSWFNFGHIKFQHPSLHHCTFPTTNVPWNSHCWPISSQTEKSHELNDKQYNITKSS